MDVGRRLRRAVGDGLVEFRDDEVERSCTEGGEGIGAADTSRREVECTNRWVEASLRAEMGRETRSMRWIWWILGRILRMLSVLCCLKNVQYNVVEVWIYDDRSGQASVRSEVAMVSQCCLTLPPGMNSDKQWVN